MHQGVKTRKRAALKVATTNMRGYATGRGQALEPGEPPTGNKWNDVSRAMNEKRIAIMVLQETHMDGEKYNEVMSLFGRKMAILYTHDEEAPTRRAGVAIALNRSLIKTDNIKRTEIIPGRAMQVDVEIKDGKTLNILAIYAPNAPHENRWFWETLRLHYTGTVNGRQRPKPEIMLGDFNVVEDAIDRLPAHEDNANTVEALNELRQTLGLKDGWRNTYPEKKAYTYVQTNGNASHSRIDRIYITEKVHETAREWEISSRSGIPGSDHGIASVQIVNEEAPILGQGRWSVPEYITRDWKTKDFAKKKGRVVAEALKQMKENPQERTEMRNPQTLLIGWKKEITQYARKRQRTIKPRLEKMIKDKEEELESALNEDQRPEDERKEIAAKIRDKITELEAKRINNTKKEAAARNALEGETMSKYWSAINKDKKPRDIIYALRKPEQQEGEDPYEKNSEKMADLARRYHETLQKEGMVVEQGNENQRDRDIEETLQVVEPGRTIGEPERKMMTTKIETYQVEEALLKSENGKAAGLDGITYELWKVLHAEYKKDKKKKDKEDAQKEADGTNDQLNRDAGNNPQEREDTEQTPDQNRDQPTINETSNEESASVTGEEKGKEEETPEPFDVIEMLTDVYNDIAEHGKTSESSFADGWMCPAYKKNDRNEIANYRPLTMLNTDYKILTKVLAKRLGQISTKILHPNQAGFVPGRQISDQTKTIEMAIEYAECEEIDGAIVALDQEKAYDKVAHDYMWKALRAYGLPNDFINLVKSLYGGATTQVMINGVLSKPYKIIRGVRQGDPMSCILFDIAIEPLAEALRKSNLVGLSTPDGMERLMALLFADDTTTFLSKDDKFEDLQEILDKWCRASTARFNIGKTEIIPIGTVEHRTRMLETRKLNENSTPIPDGLHIARDGEPVRILGAWVGNKLDEVGIWTQTLDKIDKTLKRWEKSKPTIEGRKLIVQMVIGGMTQYLTQVQSMPKSVEDLLTKRIRKYIWDGKPKGAVNEETLLAPIEIGGRAVLDLKARNQAIEIMWLKRYHTSDEEPMWKPLVRAIMAKNPPKTTKITEALRLDSTRQNWKPRQKQGKFITKLLETQKRTNLQLDSASFATEAKLEMPIWDHIGSEHETPNLKRPRGTIKCLIENHLVRTVREAQTLAKGAEKEDHLESPNCLCELCIEEGDNKGCERPWQCFKKARDLLGRIGTKWHPRDEGIEEPNIDPKGEPETKFEQEWQALSLTDAYRIYTEGKAKKIKPEIARIQPEKRAEVSTVKTFLNEGKAYVWFGDQDPRNCADENPEWTDTMRSLWAIREAVRRVETFGTIKIHTDQEEIADMLTTNRTRLQKSLYYPLGPARESYLQTAAALRSKESRIYIEQAPSEKEKEKAIEEDPPPPEDEAETLEKESDLKPSGIKLKNMTQKEAYQMIRSRKGKDYILRPRTEVNVFNAHFARTISKTQNEDQEDQAPILTEEKTANLWRGMRKKEISRKARAFLWMITHDAHTMGKRWQIPTYPQEIQDRMTCRKCDCEETMEHVLTKCEAVGQKELWQMAKETLERRDIQWEEMSIATLIATLGIKTTSRNSGWMRLTRIILTETAHLIWVLRCERVIKNDNAEHSVETVKKRWINKINTRLDMDKRATKAKYGRKALPSSMVYETWNGVLLNEDALPEDWVLRSGVLVGIWLGEGEGRGRNDEEEEEMEGEWEMRGEG